MRWNIVATVSQEKQPSSKKEVLELIDEFQKTNDKELETKLIFMYENLVYSLAKKFSKGNRLDEDLVQVGMIGLIAAFRRFDPSVGKSFESFAIPTIIGEMKRFIRDKTWSVHVPRRVKELGPKIKKTVEILTAKLHRSPRVEEIAEHLEVSEEEVLETMEMSKSYQALSVDRSIEADDEGSVVTLLDLVGCQEKGYEVADQQLLLEKAFSVLTNREKQIIKLTFYENFSQKETGDRLGISQMHVSRLQRRALRKLRESIRLEPTECLK